MLKQSLNIIRNLIFNRQLNRTAPVPETASFTLTEAGSWTDLFGSSGFDSILKYYRSFAYSCINARAENVAKAEVYLYEQNGKKLKERIHHPFLDLMKSVNIYGQTFRDILYLTIVHLDLFGNAYGYIVRNRLNMPEEILLLNPERVRMEFSRDSSGFVYKYNDRGKEITYTSDEIIHFRLPDPLSNFKGKATISALVDTLLSDYYQSRYQSNFYRNDARPGFFLETEKKLSDDIFDRLREQWEQRFKGPEKSGRMTILEGGIKRSKYQDNPKEVDYIKSRLAVRDEVFSIFRVPKVIMAITDQVNYANAYASLQSFTVNTILPLSNFIFTPYDNFIKKNYNKKFDLKWEFPTAEDEKTRIQCERMLLETGTVTRNEIRQQRNYEPSLDPRADELIIPVYYTGAKKN